MRPFFLPLAPILGACSEDSPAPALSPEVEYNAYRASLATGKLYVPAKYVPESSEIDLLVCGYAGKAGADPMKHLHPLRKLRALLSLTSL